MTAGAWKTSARDGGPHAECHRGTDLAGGGSRPKAGSRAVSRRGEPTGTAALTAAARRRHEESPAAASSASLRLG
ncbi:hypothetical protein SVIOM342S_03934 [Streptomyces violaceorubidus]